MKTNTRANIILDNNCFQLQGELNFATVPVLIKSAQKDLQHLQANDFEVDLAKVEHGDSAGIAMLLELNRIGHSLNKTMKIKNMPAKMEVIAEAHGVDKPLKVMFKA